MCSPLQRWWHSGEDAAIAVYPDGVGRMLIVEAAVIVVFWLVLQLFSHLLGRLLAIPVPGSSFRLPFLIVVPSMALLTTAEWRRAIIFTQTDLIYRPPFGELLQISLASIVSLRLIWAKRLFCLRPILVTAVELHLIDGQERVIPLDFPRNSEILAHLCRLTNLRYPKT
jgi:hypothetical protein